MVLNNAKHATQGVEMSVYSRCVTRAIMGFFVSVLALSAYGDGNNVIGKYVNPEHSRSLVFGQGRWVLSNKGGGTYVVAGEVIVLDSPIGTAEGTVTGNTVVFRKEDNPKRNPSDIIDYVHGTWTKVEKGSGSVHSKPGESANCDELFERAFPSERDRSLWMAGRDIPPSDWVAYKSADEARCQWITQH